ncbi:DNA-3-methyladenine glycosylase I [Streptococcus dysgalactiae]|uniref:DNA-3-methyladenine glycosylase I n=1 Tax=Streptococcus dysgalactiae TaxID=1334 RepID=A0AAE9UM38_STRDY|nr:DNA-3-methyladenine glycosylase I [Streptococcus dysgalactiae]QGH03903.1 DNA-3-methyladenine glycosylase I [Streptococcus dysgalactiae subsp. dysgalactiae]WAI93009.1 DNA-3-methyladenine glycosylase I [Streptococcus dysgalactiae]WCE85269.1 DNA-3-methyladenine glycosylase I [Streptococcus dysgalactiae]WCN25269.1 DNA-3-methyladenine glycosylase I [Streptococcus dysgalactiae]BBE41285.1 DNA-3-methyladenine glycosylase 1 [Streptococcus dysgalactiae]
MKRCSWVPKANQLYCDYHDLEWGHPLDDDRDFFELLCLESYQSGLSWLTVLKKRQAFRTVFHHYDIAAVAAFTLEEMADALQNPSIIRHRLKLEATVNNAKAVQKIQEEFGSFTTYLWDFVGGKPIDNLVNQEHPVPAQTDLSVRLAKDLKKRGFRFLGPTTVYSFMQASGLVNDHEETCAFKLITTKRR